MTYTITVTDSNYIQNSSTTWTNVNTFKLRFHYSNVGNFRNFALVFLSCDKVNDS